MWNPFRLRSAEARRIEIRLAEVEDDLSKLTRLYERIDARGRKQSSRDVAAGEGGAPTGGPGSERSLAVSNGAPSAVDRETLVSRARRQGLIR